jgi:hypothetical protein
VIREAAGSDALEFYDPGPGTVSGARYARHAQGPAPSGNSLLVLTDVPNTLGVLLDANGYISSVFSVSGVTLAFPVAAWNGSGVVWIGERDLLGGSGRVTWRSFNLSGTLLGGFNGTTPASTTPQNVACDTSGNLVVCNAFETERRNTSGTLLNSMSNGGYNLALDSSGNVTIGNGLAQLASYTSSFAFRWSVTSPGGFSQYGSAVDSSGNVFLAYADTSGGLNLRQHSSSGAINWTAALPFSGGSARVEDVWSDGSNAYLVAVDAAGVAHRLKYNSSGSLLWDELIWWSEGYTAPKTMRGTGSLITYGGVR